MNPKELRNRWRRTLAANLRCVGRRLNQRGPLNARAVHDLRVTLRRSRLLLQLRSKRRDRRRTKTFRAAARKVLDAFAPVRDYDVAVEWARAQHASPELLVRLLRGRAALGRQAERKLSRLKSGMDPKRLKRADKIDPDKLARRFHRWFSAMAARSLASARLAPQFSTAELHALRRDIRRWRYLRELLVSPQAVARDRTVQGLVAAQAELGAVQNLEVVLAALQHCGRSREVVTLKQAARSGLAANRALAMRELRHFSIAAGRTSHGAV